MKKNALAITVTLLIFIIMTLSACTGDRAVQSMTVIEGLKTEYAKDEVPDFSGIKVNVAYNDGSTEVVGYEKLSIGELDTSILGDTLLTISYDGFSIAIEITIGKSSQSGENYFITAASLPDSLALWETNKTDFLNKDRIYTIGDDNEFIFTLKLDAFTASGDKISVTSYTSASEVFLFGTSTPLSGDELTKYVSINEEKNSFDFTDAAVGESFVISTRPSSRLAGEEADFTKSLAVTVVDGYNVYKPYELNYITNAGLLDFSEVDSAETRDQATIVKDFLKNEKGVDIPENINALVLHNNLTLERTDLPAEYFYQKNRSNDFYEDMAIFCHENSSTQRNLAIHGNYFAIYTHKLPGVVGSGIANQTNTISDSMLFFFSVAGDKDKNYDFYNYSTTLSNLMLSGSDPQSDNEASSEKSMLGLVAIKSRYQVMNIDNSNVTSFFIGLLAEYDYQTVNINESYLHNSWQNHIHLISYNKVQEADDEPLSKDIYPRLTLNVTKSIVTQCGGPAIIACSDTPTENKNKYGGVSASISEDSVVENWVTGEEAWFKVFGIASLASTIKQFDKPLNKNLGSTFIKEEIKMVNGKQQTFRLVNLVMVNIVVIDISVDVSSLINDILFGATDIDGKLTVGDRTVLDMDDYNVGGRQQYFGNSAVCDIKDKSKSTSVFETPDGSVAYLSSGLNLYKGDITASEEKDYITLYYGGMAFVFGDYHKIIGN